MPPHRLLTRLLVLVSVTAAPTAQIDWTQLQPATSPGPRSKHRLVEDAVTGNLLMFGGYDGTHLAETWRWDGSTWAQLSPANAPPARWQHAMAFDFVRARVVLFSGWNGSTAYWADTWEWDGTDWQNMQPTVQPAGRDHHAMAFDIRRLRTVLFGGWNHPGGQILYDDTWEWDGTIWTHIVPPSAPPPRDGHAMCYDWANGNIVMFGGGREPIGSPALGDTWIYDSLARTWTQQTPTRSPAPRYNHRMVFDHHRQTVVLYGGEDRTLGTNPFGDIWDWDGTDWTPRTTVAAPSARAYAGLAYEASSSSCILFGGDDGVATGPVANNETWRLAPTSPADVQRIGSGCAGTAGTPVLSLAGPGLPWIGTNFVTGAARLPASATGAMLLGTSRTMIGGVPLPFDLTSIGMTGCNIYQSSELAFAIAAQNGSASWTLPIPNNAFLLGAQIYLQAFVQDPGANPFGATLTDGGALTIGGR